MKIKSAHIWFIIAFFMACYATNLRNDKKVLEYKIKNTTGLLKWYQPRIKSYVIITQRQSNIISKYQSSWNELKKDSVLLSEISKLY